MPKRLVVISGRGIRESREWVPSANEALRLIRDYVKLRRPGVRVEDERGNPISFFQLQVLAESESREKDSRT
jgi:hypothetical protein